MTRLPGTYLWIAGDGPLRGELEALAARRGVAERVRFLGWRADTAELFAAADICVYPSRSEPHGTVTIEAWAHRVPLVAAASAGPSELIDDGVNGILVPIDDPASLALAVGRLVADRALADGLADAGRATYETTYTEAAVVRSYLDFFARVAP
jgi:glycosyltransferase involved in cell wall biosynthesis